MSEAAQRQSGEKQKIMLIVPMLHQGGLENVCVQTARLLQPYYDVTLLVFTRKDQFFDVSGLDVVDLELPAADGTWNKAVNLLRRCRAIRKEKKQRHIALTYSFGATANLANVFSRAGDIIVTGFRSSVDLENHRQVHLFGSRSDMVICCSKDIERILRQENFHNTAVLYNPFDANLIYRKMEERPEPDKQDTNTSDSRMTEDLPFACNTMGRVLVSVGRDDDYKGYWHLIKALSVLHKDPLYAAQYSDVKLSLVGSGSYDDYRKLAAGLGIEKDVMFVGARANPFPCLRNAAAFVLTSNHEGFPNALVEAMACAVPVIACDCLSGPREILLSGEQYERIQGKDAEEMFIKPEGEASGIKLVQGAYGWLIPNMSALKDTNPGHITQEDRNLAGELAFCLGSTSDLQEYGPKARRRSFDFSYEHYIQNLCGILEKMLRSE